MQTPADPGLTSVLLRLLKIGFGFASIVSLALGVWMVVSPEGWFDIFPGAISDFGPLNAHFVRDLGGWYIASGVIFVFAFTNPMRFGGVALIVNFIAAGVHAGSHISEVVSGRVDAKHWIIDTPTIFVPFLFGLVLLWIWWRLQASRILTDAS
ncbi:MAG: hypothetical protein ABIS18_02600 [Actinomycetota bacterium]